jgi:hypothetical protein
VLLEQSAAFADEPQIPVAGQPVVADEMALRGWCAGNFEDRGAFVDFIELCDVDRIDTEL